MLKEQKIKRAQSLRRQTRTRSRLFGTTERPRLSVNVSNQNVIAQIIDDTAGKTLAHASTVNAKVDGSLAKKAEWVGQEIAKAAKSAKIKHIVFDRGDKKYHARLDALAQAARKGGLEF